jgi:putative endopeptidase
MRNNTGFLLALLCAAPLVTLAAGAGSESTATPGLNLDWLDKSVDPGQNFFSFADGSWQKNNPIPAAYSRWGSFNVLLKHNQEVIQQLLEENAKKTDVKPGSVEQKVGDFYATGMDEAAVDAAGIKPLEPEFQRIDAIKNMTDLQDDVAHLQMIGVNAMFGFGEIQDFKDSTKVIGIAGQGGIGLPDRDYYLKTSDKCVAPPTIPAGQTAQPGQPTQADYDACKNQADQYQKTRDAYLTHLGKTFQLLGDAPDKSAAEAKTVMAIETDLAQASMSRVDRRNLDNIYNPKTLAQLHELTPNFSWDGYFKNVGHPELTGIDVGMPDFFKGLDGELTKVPMDDWKTYLRWQLVDAFAPYLSKPFVDENFQMTSALTGAKELLPRWQRVVTAEDDALGDAIGKLYVDKEFPPSSKQQVLHILHDIRKALHQDLDTLAWMSPATRTAAIKKLDMMAERIGYPDKWRDYSALDIKRDSYALNVMRANEFEQKRELNKIGKPVDKNEWGMTPQTVNAYYSPLRNNINFPAGILQPPFFDPKAPMAVNFGSLGFVMGHEMTHGFDDQGAQFDGSGNRLPKPGWWTQGDYDKFQAATDCISDHFSQYTVNGDQHVQGKLVTGEATADLGGLTLAWRAFHASPEYKKAKTIDGYTPDQQFFLGAAHVWATNIRPEAARLQVTTDPHPPAQYRVNGTLANMPQFQQAFKVKAGSPMVNKDRCVIW